MYYVWVQTRHLSVCIRFEAEVIVGVNLHLLSLTTGLPHPLAHEPLISIDYDGRNKSLGVRTDISQGLLGFMIYLEFFEGISELWVWDWKHATLRLVRASLCHARSLH